MPMRSRTALTALVFFALVANVNFLRGTFAQSRKVTVNAQGSVDTKPDQLQFSVMLIKYGASTQKAKGAFDELKREFLSAFNVMKFKGLSMRSSAKTLTTQTQPAFAVPAAGGAPPIAFGGGGGGFGGGGAPPVAAESQYYATETFHITVDSIDEMNAEEIDALVGKFNKELKLLGLSSSTGFSSSLKSQTPFLKKAYAKAIEEAKFKAEGLADLSNAKIGKVIEVKENSNFIQPAGFNSYMMSTMPISYGQPVGGGISSKQTIMVSLTVTFELTD